MVSFFRELPFQIQIQGQLSIFRFAAGFSKSVDPLSGMTVNLKYVNSWLEALQQDCRGRHFSDPGEMLMAANAFLEPLAQEQRALVTRLQIRFENQDQLSKSFDEKLNENFEFQKSWWVTRTSPQQRVRMTAIFSILDWSEVQKLQALDVAESYQSDVGDLFQNFLAKPFSIEIQDPLTGSSLLSIENRQLAYKDKK